MPSMSRRAIYRALCAVLGVLLALVGLLAFGAFISYHLPGADPGIPTGPTGFYFVAFSGCALIAWGGCLIGAARRPEGARAVGTASAVGLVMCALMRIVAWIVGDYYEWAGELLRVEAAIFLVLALAFLWLRPAPVAPETV
jgi:hypothetical protein